jgi:hypothetical protein
MNKLRVESASQLIDKEWLSLPGGELQAPRPSVLCPACRAKQRANLSNPSNPPACFACHRATIARERALKAAGELNTASSERFQSALPFEAVNQPRLAELRTNREISRVASREGVGRYVDKRRQAQIAARHALDRIVIGLRDRNLTTSERARMVSNATHAAELQLPEAWLPFVVSR